MIHSVRFKAVLDTNVIYPVVIRDLLLWFAYYDLYTPKWSRHIFDEWEKVILSKGIDKEEASKRVENVNKAFPDALVLNYEKLIDNLELSDPKDCHVLAAAIKANAHIVITHNLKDFPEEYLYTFGLKAQSPDDFLTDIIDLNQEEAQKAFKEMVLNKRNPDLDEYQVLDSLRKAGLQNTADYLHTFL